MRQLLPLLLFPALLAAADSPAAKSPRHYAFVALANPRAIAVDEKGNLYVGDVDAAKVFKITPAGVAVDAAGVTWLPDQGFNDGDTIDRPDIKIANTKTPSPYQAERYSMTKFTQKLPNGKYVVKLHFAETYEGIGGPGERVFSFNVEGHEFKDFDVWVKAGGPLRAYIETVNVDITDGQLDIVFTSKIENPEINAIEIIPAS